MIRKIGWVIVFLNLFSMLMSLNFFLFMAHFPVLAWLFFNACFPSALIFIVGFLLHSPLVMAAALPFLLYFGGGGLFVFSWSGSMLMAQMGHIFMVLAAIYTIYYCYSSASWKQFIIGIIMGVVIFVVFFPIQQKYVKEHPEYIQKLGDPKFTQFIKK